MQRPRCCFGNGCSLHFVEVKDPNVRRPRRVLLIEDDPVVRTSVAQELTASGHFVVVAEAGDVRGARAALETADADLAIVDLELRDGSALPLIPRAVERGIGVLVLTIWDDDERLYRALRAGAGGYILKKDAAADRAAALTTLLEGGAPISPTIARRLLEDLRSRTAPPTPNVTALTDREREIIELFAKGATYGEVAELLDISVNTVRFHVRSMYRKLHVCSKAEAVTLAFSRM